MRFTRSGSSELFQIQIDPRRCGGPLGMYRIVLLLPQRVEPRRRP